MSANRIQAYQYFQTGDIPTEAQFQFVFNNIWFKDEKFNMSDISGLSTAFENTLSVEQLDNHIDDELAHTGYLVKKDGSNIDVPTWKTLLDIVRIATIDEGTSLGNVFTKEQVQAVFDDFMTNIESIREALASNDFNLDELQEIVDYIKQNREAIEALQAVIIGSTTDDKITLTGNYSTWGAISLQNQLNDAVYNKIIHVEDQLNVGKIKHEEVIQVNTTIDHRLDTIDLLVVAIDMVTKYNVPVRYQIVDPDNLRVEFDDLPVNPLRITIRKL